MTNLVERALHRLGQQMQGRLARQGDDAYAAATAIWAKSVGPMPRAVAHCRTPADVQAAIRAARDADIRLSVRGGGHDWAGRALCDGLVIDLSGMKRVDAYRENITARVGGGARAQDVVAVTEPLGLAPVTGSAGVVGMAGLTLGGGYGPLIGRFGLALDNLLAAEVVLADGRIVRAMPGSEDDLFWALRGGGGNFGVVTEMHIRLHYLPSVHSGMLIYPFSEAKTVIASCADISATAPDDLTIQIALATAPDGSPVVLVVPTWCGEPTQGESRLSPLLKLGTLIAGAVQPISYGASLAMFDAFIVNGRRTFMETCWLPALTDTSIDIAVGAMSASASAGCAIVTHEFKGAASRVPADTTAFGLRRDHVMIEIIAACDAASRDEEKQRHQQWALATRRALDAAALPGGYPNLLVHGDADRIAKSYGPNVDRIRKAKRHYDPDGIFSSAIPLPLHEC